MGFLYIFLYIFIYFYILRYVFAYPSDRGVRRGHFEGWDFYVYFLYTFIYCVTFLPTPLTEGSHGGILRDGIFIYILIYFLYYFIY